MADDEWPFDQARSCAVITLRSIAFGGEAILYVSHDADDHGWQFLDGRPVNEGEAMVVALEEIAEMDPSVMGVAGLPPGWFAVRESVDSSWRRRPKGR